MSQTFSVCSPGEILLGVRPCLRPGDEFAGLLCPLTSLSAVSGPGPPGEGFWGPSDPYSSPWAGLETLGVQSSLHWDFSHRGLCGTVGLPLWWLQSHLLPLSRAWHVPCPRSPQVRDVGHLQLSWRLHWLSAFGVAPGEPPDLARCRSLGSALPPWEVLGMSGGGGLLSPRLGRGGSTARGSLSMLWRSKCSHQSSC